MDHQNNAFSTSEANAMQHEKGEIIAEDMELPSSSHGLTLQVDFAWSKFRNQISERNGTHLEPLYIQHFGVKKPQLKFESAANASQFASSIIHNFRINAECTIRGREIDIKPMSRLKTQYNYLSHTFAAGPNAAPVPIIWITNCTLKVWNFVCLDANQLPIAKFSVNLWAAKQVGNFHFEKPKEQIREEERDEIVVAGITILYVMMTRMNNPLNLLGAAFAKPEKVEAPRDDVEFAGHSGGYDKTKDM